MFVLFQRIIRGFLARQRVARKLEVARQQAEKIAALLTHIEDLSLKALSQQRSVQRSDKDIPSSEGLKLCASLMRLNYKKKINKSIHEAH